MTSVTPRRRGLVVVIAAVAMAVPAGLVRAQPRVVDAPIATPAGEFGRALVAVGERLAVGAPGTRVSGHDRAGLVWTFTSEGVLERTFENPAPDDGAEFGRALATDGELLHVAAPGDVSVALSGRGAVFSFDVTTGALVGVVRAPAAEATGAPIGGTPLGPVPVQSTASRAVAAGFGEALAASGDLLVVGAPASAIDGLPDAGAVYVFDVRGTLRHTLRETSPEAGARLGAAVAMAGDLVFVGVPGASAGGARGAGVVRVFDAASGTERARVVAPAPAQDAAFGATVGTVGAALFVGAPGDDGGRVFVFPSDGGAPVAIDAPAGGAPGFGRVAGAAGDDLLVGADLADDRAGRAYLVDPRTGAVRATFVAATRRPGGRFGFALAALGTTIAIGEPAPGDGPGRVHLFSAAVRDDATPTSRLGTPSIAAGPSRVAPPGCAHAATRASVECRLRTLAQTSSQLAHGRLAGRLRRARVAVRRADRLTGTRRARTLRRALADVAAFARGLGGSSDDGVRDAAEAVQRDLAVLAATSRS